jgi:adenylate kinase
MLRVVLFGPPGAGKGTQARRIAERLGVPAISIGEIFRSHVTERTDLGRRAQPYLDAGNLVPDDITVAVVRDRLAQPDAKAGFLLDGFPRTVHQAEGLRGLLAETGRRLDCALELIVDEEELVRRLSSRRLSGDIAGVRRKDDHPDTIRHRLAVYREQTAPLSEYYEAQGLLMRIDGTGAVEEVTDRAMAALQAVVSRRSS